LYIKVCKIEHLLFHFTSQVSKLAQELELLKHCSVGDRTANLMTSENACEDLVSKGPLLEVEAVSPSEDRQALW
jgi:hypothetical protein